MRNSLLRGAIGSTALALLSFPAWAVNYNGVDFSGVDPDQVASGEISFGNQPAVRLISRDECGRLIDEEDECDSAYLWFARSSEKLAVGTPVNVTLRDRNGKTRTGTGTVTANGVRVNVAPIPGEPRRTSSLGAPGLRVDFGYDDRTLPDGNGGLGIRFVAGSPGSERFILVSPEDFEGESGGVRIMTPFGPTVVSRRTYLGLMAYYGNWDVDESAVFPAGSESRGWAYQVQSAPGGSTGLAFPGTVPLDLTVDNDIEEWGLGFNLATPPSDRGVAYEFGMQYSQMTQDMSNSVTSPTFTGASLVRADMDEEVRDRKLLLPIGIRRYWNSGGDVSPFVRGMVAPGYYDSDLRGTFMSVCNLCPPDQRSLVQDIRDSDSGFTWEASAGLGVDFRLADRFLIGLYANYGYRDRVSTADNRESPLDDPPRLGDDDADFWTAGISFGFELRD